MKNLIFSAIILASAVAVCPRLGMQSLEAKHHKHHKHKKEDPIYLKVSDREFRREIVKASLYLLRSQEDMLKEIDRLDKEIAILCEKLNISRVESESEKTSD